MGIADGSGEILLLGLTPPRRSVSPDEAARIADVTLGRLDGLDLDGLVLYDIDDESDRNPEQRPFPYLPTMDPAVFHAEYLSAWERPVVVYRCVGKYPEAELTGWLRTVDADRVLTVFVGSSSSVKPVQTRLTRAQELREQLRPDLPLGAVTIPERYSARGDEHLRMLTKQERGCSFFISQVVYNVDATKSLVSDYFYACDERGVAPRPVVFTLSVCGSPKTLAFLQWLGVDVPRWLVNSLQRTPDPLTESYRQCLANARELIDFCRNLGIPFGFNVESVSIRKVEIDASVLLAKEIRTLLR
ncbi:5,10-methylenetetrahydrofolate reductase [Cryptosporangium aurantiacum]|uniref:5,10-methylenetetrahydrofolate reductase n=1 Tax=Cryptosporangium aurantiacum TaxID=134849 RepID=A0A1M7RLI8_9ACTN|nr:5,10-methylenetetrahydrofolate reductase [Cryptosporangium aurantiacum]SHN46948.1 5,10-methylenetetrahydrofolate reductase [Cryptosporangium aurantiacum]